MIKTKPWSGGTDEEYETQHFGFGTQRFKIAVRQMVEQKIRSCVTDMQNYLQNALDLNDTDKTTLTQSCEKLVGLYCERANLSLGAIDEEIDKILKVPPNVLLPDDEVQADEITDDEYKQLKDEVETLKKRVERCALMEALLTAEENEFTAIEKACEVTKKNMEALDILSKSLDDPETIKTLLEQTWRLCSNIPFMKDFNIEDAMWCN